MMHAVVDHILCMEKVKYCTFKRQTEDLTLHLISSFKPPSVFSEIF